jgi:hypothetical protein
MSSISANTVKSPAPRAARRPVRPFLGVIDSVLVADPVDFEFDGAISHKHAAAAWTWMVRDLAPDLIDAEVDDTDPDAVQGLIALLPELLARARQSMLGAAAGADADHKLRTQLGNPDAVKRLPLVLNALKCRPVLEKAQSFGRATNGMTDEAALATALQAMPLNDHAIAALLMHAAVGQVANPSRLMIAVIKLAGAPTETAIFRAGFAPFVEALLAHAQNQIPVLNQMGPFADIDLTCRAIDRFHKLVRAIHGYVELNRNGRWTMIVSALTKAVSERVEPKLRDVVVNLNMAMRRGREGADRVDADQLLAALNGVYILTAVRDSRDSLALNAIFDQTWNQVGQALEIHIQRNLDMLRANPMDRNIGERLDTAIKMAELRFNPEYADVLRRAKDAAQR